MASNANVCYAYTVVHVKDVAKSMAFYAKAFNYSARRLDDFHRWGELDSGKTMIAFALIHQHEADDKIGSVHIPKPGSKRGPIELMFTYPEVDAAYKRAVENGAVPVKDPEVKKWGQKVAYVRDIDGIIVGMGNHVIEPRHS